MFSEEQKKLLDADLLRSNVKGRKVAGRQVSYIEGWHTIAEANRIFGFDGWSSETVDIRCVAEKDREIGESKLPGFGVTYIAKVRISTDSGPMREGVGTGHGIDRDLGQAHESAIKEAETDARKRALMTFGNQFGLALYDKTQENVEDDTAPQPHRTMATPMSKPPTASQATTQPPSTAPKMTPAEWAMAQIAAIRTSTVPELAAWERLHVKAMEKLHQSNADLHQDIMDNLAARREAIATP